MDEESAIRQFIRESGLAPKVQRALSSMLLPSSRLRSQPVDEDTVPLGASKLGGVPDMLPAMEWPRLRGRPLTSIAQINLADVAPYDSRGDLPSLGLLLFFYDADRQPWGGEPNDGGGWRVLFFDQSQMALTRHSPPSELPAAQQFSPCLLLPSPEWTLPPFESLAMEALGFSFEAMYSVAHGATPESRAEGERLMQLYEHVDALRDGVPVHRLLGHPDPIQGEMQTLCEAASRGLSQQSLSDAERIQLDTGAADWRLLLQVDTDDDAGMMWGDVGRIYFWIKTKDLRKRGFDGVWLTLQCS